MLEMYMLIFQLAHKCVSKLRFQYCRATKQNESYCALYVDFCPTLRTALCRVRRWVLTIFAFTVIDWSLYWKLARRGKKSRRNRDNDDDNDDRDVSSSDDDDDDDDDGGGRRGRRSGRREKRGGRKSKRNRKHGKKCRRGRKCDSDDDSDEVDTDRLTDDKHAEELKDAPRAPKKPANDFTSPMGFFRWFT